MKLIGNTEGDRHLELQEAIVVGSPDEVRKIAGFLSAAADRMDKMGTEFDHEHLSDHSEGFENSPQLIVSCNS